MFYIQEGKASIKIQELPDVVSSKMNVFYNKEMALNRGLSVLFIKSFFNNKIAIADPFCASGVRAKRFLLETNIVEKLFLNDISSYAIELSKENLKEFSNIYFYKEDASKFLRENKGFDYVDIDPFGTPVPFLESAIFSVKNRGILAITATDTASLSGTYPDKCLRRYSSKSMRTDFYNEMGLRILIYKAFLISFSFDIALIPMFSYSYRHYFRVFLKKEVGGLKAYNYFKNNIGYILYCPLCLNKKLSFNLLKEKDFCDNCFNRLDYVGPLWVGPLWDKSLVYTMIEKANEDIIYKNELKILEIIGKELDVISPWYFDISFIARQYKFSHLPNLKKFIDKIGAHKTHFTQEGIKVDLSIKDIVFYMKKELS